jgi:hypothetical protein
MFHPVITTELVDARRVDLKSDADRRRLVRTTLDEPNIISPIRTTAHSIQRSARSRRARVEHGSAESRGR